MNFFSRLFRQPPRVRKTVIRYAYIRFNELGDLIESCDALWRLFKAYEIEQEVYFFPVNKVLDDILELYPTLPPVRTYKAIREYGRLNGVDVEVYSEKID